MTLVLANGRVVFCQILVVRVDTLDSRNLGRSRQEVDDGIQNQGNTLVLERRTADSRNDLAGQGACASEKLGL